MKIVTVTLNPCIDKTFSVERVVANRKLEGQDVQEYPGGGGINVARVITRLCSEAQALWSCGGDTGNRVARLLDSEHVVFSGSLPGAMSAEWYGELLCAVRRGPRVIVDAKRATLRRALDSGVYLVKPNVRELGEVVGRELAQDIAIEQAARELVAAGCAEVVLVSLGRGGAILVTADRLEHFSAPSVPTRSRVGAGDSMVGGLTAALVQKRTLDDAVRFGVAAGAAAVMNNGTELCRREDVERLYHSVRRQEASR